MMTPLTCGRRGLVIAGVVLVLAGAGTAPGNTLSPAEEQRARALVRQLGDNSFEAREEASRQLLRMGLGVKDVLEEGSRDADLEIRRRCRDLLPAVREADRKARLEAFIADREGARSHDLPGWPLYRKLVGSDRAARELFISIQKSEAGLFLEDLDQSAKGAGEQLAGRCQELQQRLYALQPGLVRQQITLEDLAPLYLVACDNRVQPSAFATSMLSSFLYQQAPRTALTETPSHSPFKRLVLAWMNQQTDDNAVMQMLYLTNNLNMKEGLDLAVRVVRDRRVKGIGLATALTTIGKLGGKEQVALLEPLLADKTVIGPFALNRVRGNTEVRDVALAMLVHLTGQSHRDYGYPFVDTNGGFKFYAHFLGFGSEPQRVQALHRWAEWAAAHKK
jgi:hypothetical protein